MLGRRDDAGRHFEGALVQNEVMGARPWLAHTRYDDARALIAADESRASELLAKAISTYRELGMVTWAQRASEAPALRAIMHDT
jgi:hypothetical protein